MPTKSPKVNGGIKVQYLKIADLVHPDYNPRQISEYDFKNLKKSLASFDAVEPAIINTYEGRENIIVGGNQRIRAAMDLGWKEFPCVFVKLDEKQERELNIRLNRNTGLFDFAILKQEFSIPDLFDFGFEPDDFVGTAMHREVNSFLLDNGDPTGQLKEKEEASGEKEARVPVVDENEIDPLTYCAIRNRFDVGRGFCPHECLYCFTRTTPAGLQMKRDAYKLTNKTAIDNHFKLASQNGECATIGVCNDPLAPQYRERLIYVLKRAVQSQTYLIVQTKNPRALLTAVEEAQVDPQFICSKTSFSFHSDEASKIVEPGAPIYSDRLAGLVECADAGLDVILRFQPFFIDYYEGMEDSFKALESKCNRVVVEPCRISATGKKHFARVAPLLTKDGESLEAYLARLERPGQKYYGALHWYDIDPDKLHEAYMTIRTMANAHGFQFGICSGVLGYEHAELNQGEYCCQTERARELEVQHDNFSLTSLVASDRIQEFILPSLKDERFDDPQELLLMVNRLNWVNDHTMRQPYQHRNDVDKEETPSRSEAVKGSSRKRKPKRTKRGGE